MATGHNEPNGEQPIGADEYDRYSHIETETVDIIYDTECDGAWIQATSSVLLEECR